VRLFTRNGYDWSARYTAIAVTAARLRARTFTLDGEAVDPTASRCSTRSTAEAPLPRPCSTPSTCLELDGEDLRTMPLGDRKRRLARLLARRRVGIVLSAHTAEDGATIFHQACRMGPGGHCVEAAERVLPVRAVPRLVKGQESGQSGDGPGAGSGVVTRWRRRGRERDRADEPEGGDAESEHPHSRMVRLRPVAMRPPTCSGAKSKATCGSFAMVPQSLQCLPPHRKCSWALGNME
jgi:hypothetical protein